MESQEKRNTRPLRENGKIEKTKSLTDVLMTENETLVEEKEKMAKEREMFPFERGTYHFLSAIEQLELPKAHVKGRTSQAPIFLLHNNNI